MIRVSFLLVLVPMVLIILYMMKKALQNIDFRDKLDEQDDLKGTLKLARQLSPEQIKANRAEIARINKEIE